LLGETDTAERVFAQGAQANRHSPHPEARIHIAYGQFLFKLSRFEESREQLQEAVRIDAQNADARYELARTWFRLKKLDEAAREGEAAVRVGRADHRYHFLLSRIYTALGDEKAASLHAEQAAQLGDSR
jgi:tetratricopeptide (TPR) repeat protein